MKYESFKKKVIKELQKKLPNVIIHEHDTDRNNGVSLSGICIHDKNVNVAPCIYLEGFYGYYDSGKRSIDSIVEEIADIYNQTKAEGDFDLSMFCEYSNARKHLSGMLINTKKNKKLLKRMPHREFLDLSLIYCVEVAGGNGWGSASIKVQNDHMKMWSVTEDELYNQFMKNLSRRDSLIVSIMDVLGKTEAHLPDGTSTNDVPEIPMFILTNTKKIDGAVEIMRGETMERAAEMFEGDFYIIPASIHETILVPAADGEVDPQCLAGMVNDFNNGGVAKTEVLSNHVYRYSRQNRQIELAA